MKFRIKHEIEGRIRIEAVQNRMTFEQADTLQYYLDDLPFVKTASVQERTQSVTVCSDGDREQVLEALKAFSYEDVKVPEAYFQSSGRKLNREYWEKLVSHVTWRGIQVFFIPYPIRGIITAVKSVKYIKLGIMTLAKRKIEVPVLDATAIAVSIIRGDLKTAGSIMFLLGIGEILEEWTRKKSVDDLARSMSLNVGNVWLCRDGEEDIMVPSSDVEEGDLVRVYMGTVVPFDGTVVSGEAMVNQASLTGESLAVRRAEGASVYAGTIIEEGELVIRVNETSGGSKYEKIAACLEEHFPHSMAKAVVNAAKEKGLEHEELHSDVEYIVAHGISTMINGKKAIIGSYHFIFDDEKCIVDERFEGRFDSLSSEYSHLYMAIEGKLEAVICIHDPLREEAAETIRNLKAAGIKKVVMMTGDSDKTARAIAAKAGVDEYYAEVLPEDKARFVEQEKQNGSKVIMIGDGINDSPALSAADVGIAISDGAEIAREIADITIAADDLGEIVVLKELSVKLMERIHRNYRRIVGINGGLILLGVSGVVQPTTSALIHNISTLGISLKSMENLM